MTPQQDKHRRLVARLAWHLYRDEKQARKARALLHLLRVKAHLWKA